jgi:hypothetical protein
MLFPDVLAQRGNIVNLAATGEMEIVLMYVVDRLFLSFPLNFTVQKTVA